MDFSQLLHMAKKNSEVTQGQNNYYCTKYAPPKKESKDKKLSDNIQKFLQKREQEERHRKQEERAKVASLLASRDEKAKNKIRKMLKVTKSANKSVLDESIESSNSRGAPRDATTAVANSGEHVGQDDYGYVSKEANAFYQKYIEKVKDVKDDKNFAPSRPQSLRDLSSTKERVKAAISRERDEAMSHTRQRSSTATTASTSSTPRESNINIARSYTTKKTLYDPELEKREEERKKREEEQKKAKQRRPAQPPPMDFQALLKLAADKQHQPIEISAPLEVKRKPEPERLMSAREKREMEERQRYKEERAQRDRMREASNGKPKERSSNSTVNNPTTAVNRMEPNGRIPKLNQSTKSAVPPKAMSSNSQKPNSSSSSNSAINKSKTQTSSIQQKSTTAGTTKSTSSAAAATSKSTSSSKSLSSKNSTNPNVLRTSTHNSQNKTTTSASAASSSSISNQSKNPYKQSKPGAYSGPTREFPPRDISKIKPRQFPPPDVQRTREFPPSDVRRGGNAAAGGSRKPQQIPQKRRIYDDDDSEYDSDLDDFIDDGDCVEDYSSHIREIFGYDKRKYRDMDDDDLNMESSYAQMQREEFISKKLGLQEDLEDMRQEALQKKKKMQRKRARLDDDDED